MQGGLEALSGGNFGGYSIQDRLLGAGRLPPQNDVDYFLRTAVRYEEEGKLRLAQLYFQRALDADN